MHVHSLPDDCVWHVLEHCSLQHLVQCRATCRRWCGLIEAMFARRRSLRVFESRKDRDEFYAMRYYLLAHNHCNATAHATFGEGDDTLVVKPPLNHDPTTLANANPTSWLWSVFVGVHTLLVLYAPSMVQSVLVDNNTGDKCGVRLHSVTVVCKHRSAHLSSVVWSWLDSQPSVTRVSLFGMFDHTIPAALPLFTRLRHFSLSGYSGCVQSVFSQFGPSLTELSLDRLELPLDDRLSPSVLRRFGQVTRLSIGSLNTGSVSHECYVAKIDAFVRFICNHFRAVTDLHLRFALQIPLHRLLSSLSQLPRLTKLRLAQIGSSHPNHDPSKVVTCAPLHSVRWLCLESTTTTLDPFWRHCIPILFPCLEHFRVESEMRSLRGTMTITSTTLPIGFSEELLQTRIAHFRVQ